MEDRILLRTSTNNSEEYLIWLTRRFTKLLLNVLDQEIEKRGGTTALSIKKETKEICYGPEKSGTKDTLKNRPFGDNGILAFNIQSDTDDNGNFILDIQSKNEKGISYNLNETLIYIFYSLLTQAVEQANWNIDKFNIQTSSYLH